MSKDQESVQRKQKPVQKAKRISPVVHKAKVGKELSRKSLPRELFLCFPKVLASVPHPNKGDGEGVVGSFDDGALNLFLAAALHDSLLDEFGADGSARRVPGLPAARTAPEVVLLGRELAKEGHRARFLDFSGGGS